MLLILCYICLKISLSFTSAQTVVNPVVGTNNGLISGGSSIRNGTVIYYFLGIPFAIPPVGDLRFKKPLPINNWTETYNASVIKKDCFQITPNVLNPFNQDSSEDCLYLNIWTPNCNISTNMPVIIWIHGGGLTSGSPTELENGINKFDGSQLATNGVVIVTIAYRLGVFGFFCANSEEAPGNQGFWDQDMAMRWIKENIYAFGGNGNDITIMGESAGGWSVSAHVLSPISRSLYQKAIIQSGTLYLKRFLTDKESGFEFSREFAEALLCLDNSTYVACMRNIPAQVLNLAQNIQFLTQINQIVQFKPIFGEDFLPQSAVQAIKDGNFKTDCKMLLAHNQMETLGFMNGPISLVGVDLTNMKYNPQVSNDIFFDQTTAKNDINGFIGINNITIADSYTAVPFNLFDKNPLRRAAVYAIGDFALVCPTILFGANIAKHKNFTGKVYQYKLTYANTRSIARNSTWAYVTHADDLPLTFDRPSSESGWGTDDLAMSKILSGVIISFAKNSYPPQMNNQDWPAYSRSSDGSYNVSYVEIGPDPTRSGNVFINRYKGNDGYVPSIIYKCTFWDDIITSQYS